ncbi:M23 family metallopeptidase [Lysinibacillus sp. SGAir0095]|uniref:M23 family metallopeptidase n=1 Tax=Lysinibacillus sp. SGAir0095 TaxID=2070463 RepID=UPI0010CD2760|nr:M23 family metallopeptidase [Lysinibacillus sp. SGAir0095]QCR32566.1 M23 family peptidase [Lysinibacillus sp. SGAir0095]
MSSSLNNFVTPENFGHDFLHIKPETIYKQCSEDFKDLITSQQFKELIQTFNKNVKSYHFLQTTSIGGLNQYLWLDTRKKKYICVAFDSSNTIHRLLLKPYLTYPKSDQRYTKKFYNMPINAEWFVFWGGKNEFLNYHYAYESQRYAYDLVIMKDNQTYEDNHARNENYFAFNQEVVAPDSGTVVKVMNHVPDNIPGEMNEQAPAGNHVILKHLNNEYSLLAHFKQHSITVKKGDQVKQGQVLGLCGNSGNSSEPHIHFQVMNSPNLKKCKSRCIRFSNGVEPIQGDLVREGPLFYNTAITRSRSSDKLESAELIVLLGEALITIPRFIFSLFKTF